MKIAVAGAGYVGLSVALLLAQRNEVSIVDVVPEKVDLLNRGESPIRDEEIERFLREREEMGLKFRATLDAREAYEGAEYVVVATPTNYDPNLNYFDTSAVEASCSNVHSDSTAEWFSTTILLLFTPFSTTGVAVIFSRSAAMSAKPCVSSSSIGLQAPSKASAPNVMYFMSFMFL